MEHLKQSDTSSQLREAEEKLTSSQEEQSHLQEELSQTRRKAASLKHQYEQEIEDLKQTQESELTLLKDRLRKEKHSASTTVSEQVARAEKELEDQWKLRSERMVAQAEDRARRKYSDLQDEYRSLQTQLSEATMKVHMCVHAVCVNMCYQVSFARMY